MKFNMLLSVAVAAMLVGCGSSSSDDSEEQTPTQTPTETPTGGTGETTSNPTPNLTNIAYIQGIYDISGSNNTGTDTIYLSIDSSGLITTYDYQGDTIDNGANCYVKNASNGYNTAINGLTVTNDEANKAFTVDGGYQWNYGDTQSIQTVSVGGISAGGILSINGLRIATSTYLTTAVTVSEMEQQLCQ
jgi:hypothetical protein